MIIHGMTPVKLVNGTWSAVGTPVFFANKKAMLESKVLHIARNERGEIVKCVDSIEEGMVYLSAKHEESILDLVGLKDTSDSEGWMYNTFNVYE